MSRFKYFDIFGRELHEPAVTPCEPVENPRRCACGHNYHRHRYVGPERRSHCKDCACTGYSSQPTPASSPAPACEQLLESGLGRPNYRCANTVRAGEKYCVVHAPAPTTEPLTFEQAERDALEMMHDMEEKRKVPTTEPKGGEAEFRGEGETTR